MRVKSNPQKLLKIYGLSYVANYNLYFQNLWPSSWSRYGILDHNYRACLKREELQYNLVILKYTEYILLILLISYFDFNSDYTKIECRVNVVWMSRGFELNPRNYFNANISSRNLFKKTKAFFDLIYQKQN